MNLDSMDVAKAAIEMSISKREEEKELEDRFRKKDILTTAVNIGGNINNTMSKIIERALVASKKGGLIPENAHLYDGAVIGATKEALIQVLQKASGLNVGGKIGIARSGEHLCVTIFMSIGLLHLNEIAIGLGHRAIPKEKITISKI
ncbi:HutP family protein [Haloimpatiens massiliensis]|uniref:HutP family protein n=1 Tax=Haloimpatiens massiliensis TaxID=1658110 RepID=UPI000C84D2A8|nr:HutP family protein [Haloimpatiens massiliensis]